MKEITEILDNRKLNGDPDDALITAVYAQLKLMAKNRMALAIFWILGIALLLLCWLSPN